MAICLSATLSACQSSGGKTAESADKHSAGSAAEAEIRRVAIDKERGEAVEISFARGSFLLTEEAKAKLDALLDRARSRPAGGNVRIVSWSDHEYPSETERALSRSEQELADRRGREIENYLKRAAKTRGPRELEMTTFNMAARPNTFENLVGTRNARLKQALESSPSRTKTSRSIVMLVREGTSGD